MSSNTCSCFGFVSVFVIVISTKCADGWGWFVNDLEGSNGGGGGGGGGGGCKNYRWNRLNEGRTGGRRLQRWDKIVKW